MKRGGWKPLRRRAVVLGIGAVGALAVAGGIAYAAIPDTGTSTYHACMLKNVGTIRIVDPSLPASSPVAALQRTASSRDYLQPDGAGGDITG